jgi:hypothetical protein
MKTKKSQTKELSNGEGKQQKEAIKQRQRAKGLLKDVSFVAIAELQMKQHESYYYLVRKDETYTFCFTLGGMSVEGLTDDDYFTFYVKPLQLLLLFAKQAYLKFIEAPIDFTMKIQQTGDQYNRLDRNDRIRAELLQNDFDFFAIMQDERILQTLPIWFVECVDERAVGRIIHQVEELSGFNVHHLNEVQLTHIVRHLNNPGSQIAAFDVL